MYLFVCLSETILHYSQGNRQANYSSLILRYMAEHMISPLLLLCPLLQWIQRSSSADFFPHIHCFMLLCNSRQHSLGANTHLGQTCGSLRIIISPSFPLIPSSNSYPAAYHLLWSSPLLCPPFPMGQAITSNIPPHPSGIPVPKSDRHSMGTCWHVVDSPHSLTSFPGDYANPGGEPCFIPFCACPQLPFHSCQSLIPKSSFFPGTPPH